MLKPIPYLNGSLWVSEEEIKKDDYALLDGEIIHQREILLLHPKSKKIHYTSNIKIGDLPMIEMPDDGDEIEKLADEFYFNDEDEKINAGLTTLQDRMGWIKGYRTAQKDRFTEEDILQAFAEGHARFTECSESELEEKANRYLESLRPKEIIGCEEVMEQAVELMQDGMTFDKYVDQPAKYFKDGQKYVKVKFVYA